MSRLGLFVSLKDIAARDPLRLPDAFRQIERFINGGILFTPITTGALPTQTFVSGTTAQVSTARDVQLTIPLTITVAGGTVVVALSPDNITYTTVGTWTIAGATGTLVPQYRVPAGWWIRFTTTNATLGTATYY